MGITKLTIGDVYDYNIGDEFNSTYQDFDTPLPQPLWYMKILNKSFSNNGDTVFYEVKSYKEDSYVDYSTSPPHLNTTIADDTSLIFILI